MVGGRGSVQGLAAGGGTRGDMMSFKTAHQLLSSETESLAGSKLVKGVVTSCYSQTVTHGQTELHNLKGELGAEPTRMTSLLCRPNNSRGLLQGEAGRCEFPHRDHHAQLKHDDSTACCIVYVMGGRDKPN